ncbi:methylated-DNA--[protein]-cysteine S-methyltransferase [Lacihabitans soyangensis]|uniref:Methylated-DNA--protein-cysteine methyltransferase n=1 Tax=Lacihabitans soyangensis TaxID=869394 RepID=A0AAE3H1V9_9BACT|nr:methylated-DNA--[protein]-cysteine S-methyltransferase [Lacihabitans soyangensis]
MVAEYFKTFLKTAEHLLKIESDEHAIKAISFVKHTEDSSEFQPEILENAKQQLQNYFEGNLQSFNLKLDPEGTDFQKRVWDLLYKIPYGKTCTYADMANKLGDPKVIRAAASANGKNPVAIVIPCHRVIGTNGSLTGYAGGLENKRFLLDLENRVANGVMSLF